MFQVRGQTFRWLSIDSRVEPKAIHYSRLFVVYIKHYEIVSIPQLKIPKLLFIHVDVLLAMCLNAKWIYGSENSSCDEGL